MEEALRRCSEGNGADTRKGETARGWLKIVRSELEEAEAQVNTEVPEVPEGIPMPYSQIPCMSLLQVWRD